MRSTVHAKYNAEFVILRVDITVQLHRGGKETF